MVLRLMCHTQVDQARILAPRLTSLEWFLFELGDSPESCQRGVYALSRRTIRPAWELADEPNSNCLLLYTFVLAPIVSGT
jgi:hypothetical protein